MSQAATHEPLAWLASTKANGLPQFGKWHSRVRGAPEVLGQVPASCLAEMASAHARASASAPLPAGALISSGTLSSPSPAPKLRS